MNKKEREILLRTITVNNKKFSEEAQKLREKKSTYKKGR